MYKIFEALKQFLLVIFVLALGILFIKFIYDLITNFFVLLQNSDPTITVAVITGALTILATICAKNIEKRIEIERQHREKKILIYQDFIPKWLDIISNEQVKTMTTNQDILLFLKQSIGDLVTYSSGAVLKAFGNFRTKAIAINSNSNVSEEEKQKQSLELIYSYEQVIFAIRSDLGHKDWLSINKGQLIRIFINDFEKLKNKSKNK